MPSGRPIGSRSGKTLECETAAKEYGRMVRKALTPLFDLQLLVAHGTVYLYCIDKHWRKDDAAYRRKSISCDHSTQVGAKRP